MSDYFYYFGIIYLLSEVRALYKNLCSDKDVEKMFEDMSVATPKDRGDVSFGAVNKMVSPLKDYSIKRMAPMFCSIIFLIWLIAGCFYAPESNIFMSIIATKVFSLAITIIGCIIIAINSNEFFPTAMMEAGGELVKTKSFAIISSITILIKICATGFIIYNHFMAV